MNYCVLHKVNITHWVPGNFFQVNCWLFSSKTGSYQRMQSMRGMNAEVTKLSYFPTLPRGHICSTSLVPNPPLPGLSFWCYANFQFTQSQRHTEGSSAEPPKFFPICTEFTPFSAQLYKSGEWTYRDQGQAAPQLCPYFGILITWN